MTMLAAEQATALRPHLAELEQCEEEWVRPELLEAIRAFGDAAVEPLIALILRRVAEYVDDSAVFYAAMLLGMLKDERAAKPLALLFAYWDDELLEDLAAALAAHGLAAVEPALLTYANEELTWYQRSMAADAAVEAARLCGEMGDSTRKRIVGYLLASLNAYLLRPRPLPDDDMTLVAANISRLADLRDPDAFQ